MPVSVSRVAVDKAAEWFYYVIDVSQEFSLNDLCGSSPQGGGSAKSAALTLFAFMCTFLYLTGSSLSRQTPLPKGGPCPTWVSALSFRKHFAASVGSIDFGVCYYDLPGSFKLL
jgi:hypothetical protein